MFYTKMKKIYTTPVVQAVTIQTSYMLALSTSEANANIVDGKVDLETKDEGDYDLWDE